jgi:hypothetical protein
MMEGFKSLENPEPEVTKIGADGKKYRRVPTGYSMREYFSHETDGKGPGPGWDFRWSTLEKYKVDDPSDLPDEPYFLWLPAEDR